MSGTEVSKDLPAVVFGIEGKCGLNMISQQDLVIRGAEVEEDEDSDVVNGEIEAVVEEKFSDMLKLGDLESVEVNDVSGNGNGECEVGNNCEWDAENLEIGKGFGFGNRLGIEGVADDLMKLELEFGDLESVEVNDVSVGCEGGNRNDECDARIEICENRSGIEGVADDLINLESKFGGFESVESGEVNSISGNANGGFEVENRTGECDGRIKICSVENLERDERFGVGVIDLVRDLEPVENGEVNCTSGNLNVGFVVENRNGECDGRIMICSVENLERDEGFEVGVADLVSVENGEVNNTSGSVKGGCEVEKTNGECVGRSKICSTENFEIGKGFEAGVVDLVEDLSLVVKDGVSLTREVVETAEHDVMPSSLEWTTKMEEMPEVDVKTTLSVNKNENENQPFDNVLGQADESSTVVSSIDCKVETVCELGVECNDEEFVASHFRSGIDDDSGTSSQIEAAVSTESFPASDDHLSHCGSEVTENGIACNDSCSLSVPVEASSEPAKDAAVTENEVTVENAVSTGQTSSLDLKPEPDTCAHNTASNVVVSKEATCKTMRKPFNFLVRIPRFEDDDLREQIKLAKLHVDEKTKCRDVIQVQIQEIRANNQIHSVDYELAKAEGRNSRKLVRSKRMEIDSLQKVINKAKNAVSIEDIDIQIYNMEHMIQHETLQLKEEKQIIREIKQLKQLREQLSSNMGSQDEVNQALEKREEAETRLKILRKELDFLKDRVLKAEAAAVEAEKKYVSENKKVKELQAQFKAADEVRQLAFAQLQTLRKELSNKNTHFFKYQDGAMVANNCVFNDDTEAIYCLCTKNVENFMELWNTNGEFREDYVQFNEWSTVRRFGTLDGRSLGLDELPSVYDGRVGRTISSPLRVDVASQTPNVEDENHKVLHEEPAMPVVENGYNSGSGRDISVCVYEEQREEIELIKKVEENRRNEDETKLKEQRRLEALVKANEARERKKRQAEKLQMRAELKTLKEAEQKEKEREKRLRKKERKKVATTSDVVETNQDSETTTILESSPDPATPKKATQKPWSFAKQSKLKSLPHALRNRNKKKLQQWLWMGITSFIILVIFWILLFEPEARRSFIMLAHRNRLDSLPLLGGDI